MKRIKTFIYRIKTLLFINGRTSIEKQTESREQNFNKVDKILNMSLRNLNFFVE